MKSSYEHEIQDSFYILHLRYPI